MSKGLSGISRPILNSMEKRAKQSSIRFFEQIYDQIKDIRNAMHTGSYWEENLGRTGLSYYKDAFLDVLSRDFAG